ncbi:MAG TPA: succinate dehydrogenase, cytochrome b556 subunit [Steroidobacteraceae bacterium]|nr:succinate dehydrogenase, cytochrome b556 subunit [Steroidobacteraceae bacterium]
MRERPLSPHMSVYRMTRYSLLTSIGNRATGLLLSIGLLMLVCWLAALAGGARVYAKVLAAFAAPAYKLVYAALLAAFAYHLIAGIRHLIWDTGHGLERAQSQRSAHLVIAAAAVLAAACIWWALAPHGAAP